MSAPNIVNVATITAKTVAVALSTTNSTSVVNNPASSGKVLKVNNLVVANVNGSTAANITITYWSQANIGGTGYQIASTISVPANASLVVIDKSTSMYLEEDRSIGATAGTANYLVVTSSYEEIS